MLQGIMPDDHNIVLELGVGTGAITKFLREVVPDDAIRISASNSIAIWSRLLIKNFPDMKIVCGNAADAYRSTRIGSR